MVAYRQVDWDGFVTSRYDSSHPHYTPQWLSERVSGFIPSKFRGRIVDPACGGGNLLLAASDRFSRGVEFIGVDLSKKAVRSCSELLSVAAGVRSFDVIHADYLKLNVVPQSSEKVAVIMNPPFGGYGSMTTATRSRIRRSFGLQGRFNLSHAFVVKALRDFQPEYLVAVLPSTWHGSRSSYMAVALEEFQGTWIWEDVGDAFPGITAHVGLLFWRRGGGPLKVAKSGSQNVANSVLPAGFEVRQGVATGRDSVFRELAEMRFFGGRVVESVVGRDVGRGSSSEIWMPFKTTLTDDQDAIARLPTRMKKELEMRACCEAGRRSTLEHQESFPSWFFGAPKILIPEVVTSASYVEFDAHGALFPLHSVFAVRVPTRKAGNSFLRHLQTESEWRRLTRSGPKLSGGARRLTASAIRSSVLRWARSDPE